jgi:hypothetical protein
MMQEEEESDMFVVLWEAYDVILGKLYIKNLNCLISKKSV